MNQQAIIKKNKIKTKKTGHKSIASDLYDSRK